MVTNPHYLYRMTVLGALAALASHVSGDVLCGAMLPVVIECSKDKARRGCWRQRAVGAQEGVPMAAAAAGGGGGGGGGRRRWRRRRAGGPPARRPPRPYTPPPKHASFTPHPPTHPTPPHPIPTPQVPNVKFNVAKMLERMAPLTDPTVVESTIKPALRELTEDGDVDVRFYAAQALYGIDSMGGPEAMATS
jgi:hypothetical protein